MWPNWLRRQLRVLENVGSSPTIPIPQINAPACLPAGRDYKTDKSGLNNTDLQGQHIKGMVGDKPTTTQ
jgi:hypothetical protein